MKNLLYIPVVSLCISCSHGSEKNNSAKNDSAYSEVKDNSPVFRPPANVLSTDITDSSLGEIKSSTTYEDLQKIFKDDIKDTIDFGPEGSDTFTVTKIFSGSS